MFGSNKDYQQQQTMDPAQDPAAQSQIDGFLPAHTATQDDSGIQQPVDDMMSNGPPEVASEAAPSDYIMTDAPTPPADSIPVTVNPSAPTAEPAPIADPVPVAASTSNDDLLALKQQALQQLSPLVGQLDQSPEDKFRTTMMMLQSTDDQSLVRVAYESAQGITDEKVRAQALLDIINEINYFTQKNSQDPK